MTNKGITNEGDIKQINLRLKNQYGVAPNGNPRFRVVWSDSQTEKRFGRYAEFYGKIFVREVVGLHETKKYPYIKERWILEQWNPPEITYDAQIPETAEGAYDPAWTFQHDEGYPVHVSFEIIQAIIYEMEHKPLPGHRASQQRTEETKKFDTEVAQNVLDLEERGSANKVFGKAII
jgi:hypothetical protein